MIRDLDPVWSMVLDIAALTDPDDDGRKRVTVELHPDTPWPDTLPGAPA